MVRVGVWERDEGILSAVSAGAQGLEFQLMGGRHPAELAIQPLDLLVISPCASGWAGAGAVDCRAVLLPGQVGPLARLLRGEYAVSYGTSPRDTITFSSMEGDRIALALQRELVTLEGTVVDRQELVLRFPPERSHLALLAAAGALLLLGVPPERLDLRRD